MRFTNATIAYSSEQQGAKYSGWIHDLLLVITVTDMLIQRELELQTNSHEELAKAFSLSFFSSLTDLSSPSKVTLHCHVTGSSVMIWRFESPL